MTRDFVMLNLPFNLSSNGQFPIMDQSLALTAGFTCCLNRQ